MTRYIIISFLLLLYIPYTFSQDNTAVQGRVKGIVADADTKEGIELAIIKILSKKDSTFIAGYSASKIGGFSFNHSLGSYILEISRLGYHKGYRDISLSDKKHSINLDTIYLKADDIFLTEAEIIGDIPAMQVKGDTIEFNAAAYNIDGSTVLADFLKQIPGLELDENGSLKMNGKAISKILVDGKEYFGNNIGMALSTLPANMINKLQLFEKESEEAKASGIKDAEPEQVLNLDVKEEFKRSTFGDTKSGIGNKGRHVNNANINKIHGDNQYTITGNINNINDYGGGYGGYSMGNNFDDNINKEIGGNFNIQQSEKFSINGSATYRNDKSMDEYRSDSYSSLLDQYSFRNGQSVNRRQDINFNSTIDWKPDSLTTIYFRTNVFYNDGNNTANSMDSAIIVGTSNTSTSTRNWSKSNGIRLSNSLMISRRLNKKGRNISLNLSQSYNNDDSDGTNFSVKNYWEGNMVDTTDQVSKTESKSVAYGLSARYVEPLGEANRLYLSYSVSVNEGRRNGDVRRMDSLTREYTIKDPEYSRGTDSYSLRQNIRIGFQRAKEKYNFNLSFSVDPSSTRNKTLFVDNPPENLKQNVVNYSPSARFAWTPDKNTHINFNYYGSTSHPNITQLSTDVVTHNAMSKTVGNPNLKPSFNNSYSIDFRKSDFESGRYLSASISYSYTFNSVVGYQTVDKHSNTINSYRNVDGNSNAYLYITYNTPLKNKKFNLGGNFNTYYNRNIGFLNSKKRTIDRVSLTPTFFGRFNSDKLETSLNFALSHTIAKNNLADQKTSNNTDYRLSHTLKVKLPLDFAIESDLRFSYRSGLGEDVKKDETMWNLAASKTFLKDKRGTLKVEFFDVLNDFRQQENTVNGSDYDNYWRKVVNNYFIFSFSYRFNISGSKG